MTREQDERAAVVAAARAWLWTPYHMNARIRGVRGGVDCGQLLIACFHDAGLVEAFETGHSPQDFHLNRKEERYLDFIRRHLTEFAGPPEPGDVVMFHYGLSYSHGAIVLQAKPLTVAHAFLRARKVIEERLTRHSDVMQHERRGSPPPRYFTRWPAADRRP